MENCEELAQPQRKLEKHREPLRLLNNNHTFATALEKLILMLHEISKVGINSCSPDLNIYFPFVWPPNIVCIGSNVLGTCTTRKSLSKLSSSVLLRVLIYLEKSYSFHPLNSIHVQYKKQVHMSHYNEHITITIYSVDSLEVIFVRSRSYNCQQWKI